MRYFYLFILLGFLPFISSGQLPSDNVPDEILNMLKSAESCLESNSSDCEQSYLSALKRAEELKGDDYLNFIYYQIGRFYYIIGEQNKALSIISKGIEHSRKKNDSIFIAALLNSAGSVHFMKGNIDSAMTYFIEGVAIQEAIGDSIYAAYTYLNMGAALSGVKNYKESIDYFNKSFDILKNSSSIDYLATIAGNIGLQYFNLKKYDSAILWSNQALEIADTTKENAGLILGNYILSAVYKDLKEEDKALSYAGEAIKIARKSNHKNYLGEALNVYAHALNKLGKSEEAVNSIKEAIIIQSSMDNFFGLAQAYRTAGEIFLNIKHFKESAENFNLFVSMNDSLLAEQNIFLVNELTRKYETEKKERLLVQNQLMIEKRNAQLSQTRFGIILAVLLITGLVIYTILYRRNQRIKFLRKEQENENTVLKAWMNGEERERNRISQELHDGVASMVFAAKLNLDAISYLSEEKKNEQVIKVSSILKDTHVEVRRIAHNLLPVVLEQEGLIGAVRQFAENINQTGILQLKVVANKDLSLIEFPSHISLILYRIIQELLNNVMKHSEAHFAEVSFELDEEDLKITVKDNGKGFVEKRNEQHQGIYSIQERVKTLEGNFLFKFDNNEGTSAIINLKIGKFKRK